MLPGSGGYEEGRVSRHIKADGGLIDVSIYGRSLNYGGSPASLVAAVDITARKRAEDEARSTREFLSIVIENVPVSILVKDAVDLRYVLVNRAAEEFLGLPREQIVGKTGHDIFPSATGDAVLARDRNLVTIENCGPLEGYEIETPRNGVRTVNSKRLIIRGADGQAQYLLVMTEDVTEKRRAEAQIKHLAHHDPLTNLPNRASFNAHLAEAIDRADASDGGFAALCIDLDRFKEVNDVFGHSVGDATTRYDVAGFVDRDRQLHADQRNGFDDRFDHLFCPKVIPTRGSVCPSARPICVIRPTSADGTLPPLATRTRKRNCKNWRLNIPSARQRSKPKKRVPAPFLLAYSECSGGYCGCWGYLAQRVSTNHSVRLNLRLGLRRHRKASVRPRTITIFYRTPLSVLRSPGAKGNSHALELRYR
jgi:PAS domain S-box-containing protein